MLRYMTSVVVYNLLFRTLYLLQNIINKRIYEKKITRIKVNTCITTEFHKTWYIKQILDKLSSNQ